MFDPKDWADSGSVFNEVTREVDCIKSRDELRKYRDRCPRDSLGYAYAQHRIDLIDQDDARTRHLEILRVTKIGAVIATISALAALASAWYARSQAQSAAASARASAQTTLQQPASLAAPSPSSTPAAAQPTGTTAQPPTP